MVCCSQQCRLLCMLCLTGVLFLVELVVGYLTNSMALVADSFHMLSDVLALVVAFVSVKMSKRNWSKNTYGWARAEVLGALINSVFLIALSFSIFIEAIQRLYVLEEVRNPQLLLIVGCVGFVFNLIGLLLFHEHGHGHSHGSTHKQCHENTSKQNQVHHNHWGHNYNTGQINHSYTSDLVECKKNTNKYHLNKPNDNDQKNHQKNIQVGSYENILDIRSHNNKVTDIENHEIKKIDSWGVGKYVSHALTNNSEHQNSGSRQPEHVFSSSSSSSNKKSKADSQMNIRGVFLHLLSDACGSIIVIISALVVWLTEWEYSVYIDPVLSMCLVLLICISTFPLLRDTSFILLQGIPTNIEIDNITKQILNIEGVLDIHEFHVWQLSGKTYVASAHIKCSNVKRHLIVADEVKVIFHKEGIHSTTIQQEFVDIEENDRMSLLPKNDCILKCPADDERGCLIKSCCNSSNMDSFNTN